MRSFSNPIVDILLGSDEEPSWLVKDVFLQGSLICLGGEAGAGKSYVSYTIGLAVAAGCRAMSGIVPAAPPKRVVYFDDENDLATRDKYLKRCWVALTEGKSDTEKMTMLDNVAEYFWPVHFHLLGDEGWPDRVTEWVEFLKDEGTPPDVLMFDTAASCFDTDDENSNAEAAKHVKLLRHLMQLTHPPMTAFVLKHAKIRTDRGRRTLRGAKAWISMADMVLYQVKAVGRHRKDGLSLTRLEPDKTRAYGLTHPIYITPGYIAQGKDRKAGLKLEASYTASKEHRQKEKREDNELDEE